MSISEWIGFGFQLGSVVFGALALAYYGGQWTRSIKSIESTMLELRDDLKGVASTQQNHGERLAGLEARQAVHR